MYGFLFTLVNRAVASMDAVYCQPEATQELIRKGDKLLPGRAWAIMVLSSGNARDGGANCSK